ncbi:hypothetical protein GIB67_032309 [Kingdonia uniflora]|uniref:Uncharacterized protein n=1 Tax=Kingdonia uniflora TaxID=39325 RepID=A0A7J7MXW8_9MAGN|nr:hypothetical protein GIB67_032309 [Kingdonia uniflora]
MTSLGHAELSKAISALGRACILEEQCCRSQLQIELSISISDRNEKYTFRFVECVLIGRIGWTNNRPVRCWSSSPRVWV